MLTDCIYMVPYTSVHITVHRDRHVAVGAATALSTTKMGDSCSKCGVNTKSGKRSCCALGGDWLGKCGDAGDPDLRYTWEEGIQACEGTLTSWQSRIARPVSIYFY